MSRKYKFYNKEGLYFVSFATVYWIDVFVRLLYYDILVKSLIYCPANLGLALYVGVLCQAKYILIFRAKENNPMFVRQI